VRGKPQQHAVHLAVLKTLSRAEYSPLLIGHFALASEHYTHFTRPIRRYPDLVVHRGLDAYFDAAGERDQEERHEGTEARRHEGEDEGKESRELERLAAARRAARHGQAEERPAGAPTQAIAAWGTVPRGVSREELTRRLLDDRRIPGEEDQAELGRHCSATERNAEAAEDELRTYLVLDLLSEKLGEDFAGTVTGVTGAGVFVQIDRYLVDGFVRAGDLPGQPGDRWKLNRATGALVAQRSGKTVTIGDRYLVRIARVDPGGRKMDLVVIGQVDAQGPRPEKRRQPAGARKAHEKSMRIKQLRHQERRQRRR
jgi:ribonuclease R